VEWPNALHGVTDDIHMNQLKLSTDHCIENNTWLFLVNSKNEKEGKINQPISSCSKCKEVCTIYLHNPQLYTFIIIFYHPV
jgi:Na+-translocating ferredoxin:NAD+ oxidoreductase RnfC subunit